MSCDWQVGSIPLVECLWDGRNIASLTLALVMLALSLNCVTRLQVSTHSQISSCQDNRWDFPVFDHMKAFTHAVSHPAVLSFHQFSTTHRHSNQWKIAATVNECKRSHHVKQMFARELMHTFLTQIAHEVRCLFIRFFSSLGDYFCSSQSCKFCETHMLTVKFINHFHMPYKYTFSITDSGRISSTSKLLANLY